MRSLATGNIVHFLSKKASGNFTFFERKNMDFFSTNLFNRRIP
jgi:hypothetical protein